MRRSIWLSILALPFVLGAQTSSNDPGWALSQLTVARFSGSGRQSIQAMRTDALGNVYVAGTTWSPDLPMKNAAQSLIGGVLVARSLDRGVTWQSLIYPPAIPVDHPASG